MTQRQNLGTAQVIRADSRHLPLADNTVDLIVSSPPYWSLRSYQDNGSHYDGQLGSEATADDFLDGLLDVMRECVRVLKPTGSIFYNLGDKYGPNKSLALIPERFRIRCTDELGLIARAVIVWSKPNGLPESVTDRVRRSHEDWMHFTLEPRYFSAVDEIRVPQTGGSNYGRKDGGTSAWAEKIVANGDRAGVMGSTNPDMFNPLGKLPGSVWTIPTEPLRVPDSLGIDHFAAFPTEWPKRIIQGWSPAGVCIECGEGRRPVASKSDPYNPHQNRFTDIGAYDADNVQDNCMHGKGPTTLGYQRDTTITGYVCACPEPTADTTPAVVLDPFSGTGTTAMVAKALGRHGIGVDMSADYCRLAQWRTNDRNQLAKVLGVAKTETPDVDQLDLFGEATA